MSVRPISTVSGLAVLVLVTACAAPAKRDSRGSYDPPQSSRSVPLMAQYGRVENIGVVQTSSRSRGAGLVLGAVIGAVVGNQIGSGTGKALATGAGAIGGAVAGNAIEKRTRRDDEVFRVQVRFDNGSVRDFDFQQVDDLRVGDRVKFEDDQLHLI